LPTTAARSARKKAGRGTGLDVVYSTRVRTRVSFDPAECTPPDIGARTLPAPRP
jgi:hypothetical protein